MTQLNSHRRPISPRERRAAFRLAKEVVREASFVSAFDDSTMGALSRARVRYRLSEALAMSYDRARFVVRELLHP